MRRILFLILLSNFSCSFIFSQSPELMLPIGHTREVISASFSPNGKKIVTSSYDNVKVWDLVSGKRLIDIKSNGTRTSSTQFSPNSQKIMTTDSYQSPKIWDAATGKQLLELKSKPGDYEAKFSPDGKKILTLSGDSIAKIWDASTGNLLLVLENPAAIIWTAEFSPDSKRIVGACGDSTAKLWDALSGNILFDLRCHTNEVRNAGYSQDGKRIITSSWDRTVKIWDATSGKFLTELAAAKNGYRLALFSPDGEKVVTSTHDSLLSRRPKKFDAGIPGEIVFYPTGNSTTIWDLRSGERKDLKGLTAAVHFAEFNPDGKKLLTVTEYHTIKIWDVASGEILTELKGHKSYIYSARFSPDGKKIVTASEDNSAKLWDAKSGNLLADLMGQTEFNYSRRLSGNRKRVFTTTRDEAEIWDPASGLPQTYFETDTLMWSIDFSSNGKRLVTLSRSNSFAWDPNKRIFFQKTPTNSVGVWDLNTKTLLTSLKLGMPFTYSALDKDGTKVLTISKDSIIRIWDANDGKLLAELKKFNEALHSALFSPDGKKIFVLPAKGAARIWNMGDSLIVIGEQTVTIYDAEFSPDGDKILTRSSDKMAKIWDTQNGSLVTVIKDIRSSFSIAQFSPDGKYVFTASEDASAKIWDAHTGSLLTELKGETSFIEYVSFSEDGKKVITGNRDNTVRVWTTGNGELEIELTGHSGPVLFVEFLDDGKKIFSSSADNTSKVWNARTGQLLYTRIALENNDYLVVDNFNRYDGTEAARKLLYFTCGTEIIELDQVKDQLWVPNLAQRIMEGDSINAQKLSDLNICNLTPVVEALDQTSSQYLFEITPRLGGLGTSTVYVNGIEVKKYIPSQLKQQNGKYLLSIDKKEMLGFFVGNKDNEITVRALTAKNSISSRTASIQEENNTSTTAPNLYAIIVGVSDYKGEELDLRYAAKDAVDIAATVDNSARKLLNSDGNEHVFIYKIHTGPGRDKFPEKNSIRQVFYEIGKKAAPNDILMVFFAGHGVLDAEKNLFYFLTADASRNTASAVLKDVGISTEEITEWIKPQVMKAQKRILIFDACNSGKAIKEMISIGKKDQNFLAARGDDKSKQIKAIEKLNERSGMFILSASASDQKAYEMGKYNQGALTYSLLKAIKEEPGILEDRQYLNISRWFSAAEKSVNELSRETGARQQPQIVSTTNFNIGVVDEEVRNKIVLPFEKRLFTRSDFRNTETTIDNLKLRSLVDKELIVISEEGEASIMYSPEYEGQSVFQLSGSYAVSGNAITVSVIITQGGTEIKTKFEVRGIIDQLTILSKSISKKVLDWLAKK